jgi:bacillolysin
VGISETVARRLAGTLLIACALALGVAAGGDAQDVAAERAFAAMETAAGARLSITRSPRNGLATFISAPPGRALSVPAAKGATARDRALSFVSAYGEAFGLRDGRDVAVARSERDALGIDHVRMTQVRGGIPVTGGELIVHLREGRVLAANGKTLEDLDSVGLDPAITSLEAVNLARRFVARKFGVPRASISAPRLELFNQGMLNGRSFPTRLAWFVEARAEALREYIWIDAESRMVLLHFSQLTHARNRAIYDADSTQTTPAAPGALIRSEGQVATGAATLSDALNAYNYSGNAYDYFFTQHGRDSFDGVGGQIRSTIRECPDDEPCPYSNAYWDGFRMVYGEGFTDDDDVVAHELTHAVTERTANLFYYMQSGALNESFSDIFGETIDQWNGDPEPGGSRWLIGEELPDGAFRSMTVPTLYGDPGKMSDPEFRCDTDPIYQDAGGVHSNSGIPNHAFALMVDGGGYNGQTISPLDPNQFTSLLKAAKIQYRALTLYLTSTSDFQDNYNALNQACVDLVGVAGITAGNCADVSRALDAVEMSAPWACAPSQAATPALCPVGKQPQNVLLDDFESGLSNWTISGDLGAWYRASAPGNPANPLGPSVYATSGVDSLWGYNQESGVPDQGTLSTIGLASNLSIPAGARLHFNHSYGFDDGGGAFYDGGVIEYSTNGGSSWTSLNSRNIGGAAYGGVIDNRFNNPLGGQSAFVGDSFGYTASLYDLSTLAGQNQVRIRFRIGTDDIFDDYGWFIDDFRVYTCADQGALSINDVTINEGNSGTTNATFTVSVSAVPSSGFTVNYATANGTALSGSDYTATSGVLTFLAGQTSKTISVPILGDLVAEAAETFVVNLSGSTGPPIADSQGVGTIVNDDSSAVLSIGPVTVIEGDGGASTDMTFTVSMTGVPIETVTVDYTATDGSASAGSDYIFTPGSLSFPLGQTTRTITVTVPDDSTVEPDETFSITLSGITGGSLGVDTATGTIVNDDFTGPGAWTDTTTTAAPAGRDRPSMVWTGTHALVWGGGASGIYPDGGIFDPLANSWAALPNTGAPPSGREGHTAIWTGSKMIVWGGTDGSARLNSGSLFDPLTSTWTALPASGAPAARMNHTAVWTGSKMIVWGGFDGTNLNSGGVYDPAANSWTSVSTTGAPTGRSWHTAVWTGTRMLVWGGFDTNGGVTNTGAAYNPATNTWTAISTTGAPSERYVHTAVWTGTRMVVWGGYNPTTLAFHATGGVYDPGTDSWAPVSNTAAPQARWFHTAVWTGAQMIVWGGRQSAGNLPSGGLYDPAIDTWESTPTATAPSRRYLHSAVWTGDEMLVWGGSHGTHPITGGLYRPPGPTVTTEAATAITASEATLNGTVNPNGLATSSWFEYGVDTLYGVTTSADALGSGNAPLPTAFAATGLSCGTTYHYRAVASNSAGVGSGLDRSFSTEACPPALSVNDVSVLEGNAGTVQATFTVTLSTASALPVAVSVVTSDVTATAGADYTATGPTVLNFAPGETTQSFSVPVLGDTADEGVETAAVTLSAPANAILQDATGVLTILNDDAPGAFMAADVSTAEGYLTGSTMTFVVRLSNPLGAAASVDYGTADGTAVAGSDYTTTTGTLTFAAGETVKVVSVPVLGDAIVEANEAFTLVLSGASGATIADATAIGTILNDDGATISVTDFKIAEGTGAGTTNLAFTVINSQTASTPITIQYTTSDGTATAGSDYTTTAGTLVLEANYPSGIVNVPVTRDSNIESNETLFLNLTSATGATIFDNQGIGTIEADDGLLVSIADKTSNEGDAGNTPVTFTLTVNSSAHSGVSVDWATADGTATQPLDYVAANGTVTFAAGETTKTLTVQIVGETGQESYETFFVNLSNPVGVAVGDGQAQGTITNTDGSTDRSRLMFHNFSTNRLYRWHMRNGNTLDTFNWVTPWSTDVGWTVGAVADFDRDGQLDYLWHNTNTGKLLVWYIEGDNLKGYLFPFTYDLDVGWSVATVFDANGDGASDIVYYDTRTPAQSATSGNVRVVLHDNGTMLGSYTLSQNLPVAGTVRVVNSADANGDGDDELILYNSATGQVSAWDVSGATVGATINYADLQDTTNAFNLVSTRTDFNDDGLADFLWHNPTPTGVFSVWFMNGTTRLSVGQFQPFTATDPVWKVVGSANIW